MNDLNNWWNVLDPYWKRVFKIKLNSSLEIDKAARDAYSPSVEDLTSLTQLEHFDVSDASVSLLLPLTRFANLKSLGLYHLQKVNSISPLAEVQTLETLSLENIFANDFESLDSLSNLNLLVLRTCGVKNLDFLKNLSNLEQAAFIEPYLENLNGLEGLPQLECLKLSRIGAKDLSVLGSLPQIKKLVIKDLGTTSLMFLSTLINLKELYIKNLPVDNINSIGKLSELETLDLTSCSVQDISSLTDLKKLTSLNLIKTQVKDLEPLYALESLRTLYISEQNFSGDHIKAYIKARPDCELLTEQGRFPFHSYYLYRIKKSFKTRDHTFEEGQVLRYTDSTHNSYDDIEICYFKTQSGLTFRWDIYSHDLGNWNEYMEVIKD